MRAPSVPPRTRARRRAMPFAGSLAGAVPWLAHADPGEPGSPLLGSFIGMLVALAIVIALAYAALRLLRGAKRRGWVAQGPIRLHATLPLGVREKIVLVEVGGRLLVLGVTPQQINLLRDSPAFDPDTGTTQGAPGQSDPPRPA
jgi:flagellar protein FliO/FliZ